MLTNREMDEIYLLMKQDGFGMKRSRMLDYIVQYRQAKENGDRLTLEKIEYHLNYIWPTAVTTSARRRSCPASWSRRP